MINQDPYLPVKANPVSPKHQEFLEKPCLPSIRPQFEIGDIVWAQARGFPSWPGKVVDASEVGKGRPDDGKVMTHHSFLSHLDPQTGKRCCTDISQTFYNRILLLVPSEVNFSGSNVICAQTGKRFWKHWHVSSIVRTQVSTAETSGRPLRTSILRLDFWNRLGN